MALLVRLRIKVSLQRIPRSIVAGGLEPKLLLDAAEAFRGSEHGVSDQGPTRHRNRTNKRLREASGFSHVAFLVIGMWMVSAEGC